MLLMLVAFGSVPGTNLCNAMKVKLFTQDYNGGL